jgi:hypothetical protein
MNAVARVLDYLEAHGVTGALIGGIALSAHGIARATLDADILVADPVVLDRAFWKVPLLTGPPTVRVRPSSTSDRKVHCVQLWWFRWGQRTCGQDERHDPRHANRSGELRRWGATSSWTQASATDSPRFEAPASWWRMSLLRWREAWPGKPSLKNGMAAFRRRQSAKRFTWPAKRW